MNVYRQSLAAYFTMVRHALQAAKLKLSQNQSKYHDHMIIGYSIFARCGAPVSAACNMSLPYTLIFFSQLNQNPLSLLLDDNESHNGVASNCGTPNPNPSPNPMVCSLIDLNIFKIK